MTERLDTVLDSCGFDKGPDGIWTDADEHVGAAPGESGVTVGWIDVVWVEPSEPCRRLCDATHVPSPLLEHELGQALRATAKRRKRKLRKCKYCDEHHIPGHMDSKDVCKGCAVAHLGVVY